MGQEVVKAVSAQPDMHVVACVDPSFSDDSKCGGVKSPCFADLDDALQAVNTDVVVDFTRPDVVAQNIKVAMSHNVACVVGTTGLTEELLSELAQGSTEGACLFYAPNFAIGAVLMMRLAQDAAKYMSNVEIIELHHDKKLDAPSGTAVTTAKRIAAARTNRPEIVGSDTEIEGGQGARGALIDGIAVHSVRLPGLVAHQQVIFGDTGQTLTITHDSIDRTSFMPGVVLACREVTKHSGLIVGLENFME